MTHPITPVKLGGWEHLCGRGKTEGTEEVEEEKKKEKKRRGRGGREERGRRVKDKEEGGET